jgi:hypothetical protein
MSKPTTVAVTLDPESYAIFQEAVALTEGAGAKVTVGQLLQHHLHDEIRKQNPRKIAQRFLKSVVRQINVSPSGETAGRKN